MDYSHHRHAGWGSSASWQRCAGWLRVARLLMVAGWLLAGHDLAAQDDWPPRFGFSRPDVEPISTDAASSDPAPYDPASYDPASNDPARVTLQTVTFAPAINGLAKPAQKERDVCQAVVPGWSAAGEVLVWQLRQQALDYAISADGSASAVGVGPTNRIDFSPEAGFRFQAGYRAPNGWDVSFRFTNFLNRGVSAATAPPGGTLWATRSHPLDNEEAQTAQAEADFEYQTYDLEVGRWFEVNSSAAVRMFGGLRWLNADQGLLIAYDGNDFNDGIVSDARSDQAIGIRLGAEGRCIVGRNWRLFARGAGTVASSSSDSRLTEIDNGGTELIVDVEDSVTHPLTNLEAAIGVCWERGPWQIQGGYEMTGWMNLASRTTFDGTHQGSHDAVPHDLLLEGWFIGGGFVR